MKVINLVDGTKTENGYTFSDYSKPRKSDNSSMADFIASTYTGEYISWRDECKTVTETVINYLKEVIHYKDTEDADPLDFFRQPENVRWEYDRKNKVFYSVWIESNELTGDVFKIESVKEVKEGQKYNEGKTVKI